MSKNTRFDTYLQAVCGQVKWKKSHGVIAKELEQHLEDQKQTYLECGLEEGEAEENAVAQMGNPVEIGMAFNQVYQPPKNIVLLGSIALLLAMGLWIRMTVYAQGGNAFPMGSAIIAILLGVAMAGSCFFVSVHKMVRWSLAGYWGLLFLLGMTNFCPKVNGYHVFIGVNGVVFIISYLLLLFPIVLVGVIYRFKGKGVIGLLLTELMMAVPLGMSLLGSQLSSTVSYGCIMGMVLLYAVWKNWFGCNRFWGIGSIGLGGLIGVFVLLFSARGQYGMMRIYNALHPETDPNGVGWFALQIRDILQNAQIWGQSSWKGMELPTMETNYLLTFLIQRFGWAAFAVVILFLGVIAVEGVKMCLKQKDFLSRTLSMVVVSIFSLQTVFYIINNLGVTLFSGYPLPFINGNVSIVVNLFLMGLLMSVFRNHLLFSEEETAWEGKKFLEITDGKIIISYK